MKWKKRLFCEGLLDTLSTWDADFLPQTASSGFSNVRVSREHFQTESQPALCQSLLAAFQKWVQALSHPKESELMTREPGAGKSLDKERDGISASGLPTGDIIPSRGRSRRGRGEAGEGGRMQSGKAPGMSLTVGWPQLSGFTSIKLCVSSETLHMRLCEAFCHCWLPGASPQYLSCHWFSRKPLWELVAYVGQANQRRRGFVFYLSAWDWIFKMIIIIRFEYFDFISQGVGLALEV